MTRLLTAAITVAAAFALTACGGGSGGGSGSSGTGTVSLKTISGTGTVLVDTAGQALYAADQEAGGKIQCTATCTSIWRPLTVASGTPTGDAGGKLGVVDRPDGARQVTLDGKPLYRFSEDAPGKVTGDGAADAFAGKHFTWHVVGGGKGSSSSGGGYSARGGY